MGAHFRGIFSHFVLHDVLLLLLLLLLLKNGPLKINIMPAIALKKGVKKVGRPPPETRGQNWGPKITDTIGEKASKWPQKRLVERSGDFIGALSEPPILCVP